MRRTTYIYLCVCVFRHTHKHIHTHTGESPLTWGFHSRLLCASVGHEQVLPAPPCPYSAHSIQFVHITGGNASLLSSKWMGMSGWQITAGSSWQQATGDAAADSEHSEVRQNHMDHRPLQKAANYRAYSDALSLNKYSWQFHSFQWGNELGFKGPHSGLEPWS